VQQSADPTIFADLAPTLNRLRGAVRVILDTKHKAKAGARACAREFGFDKSIGWKIYQIGYSEDFVTALSALPGARGWEIVFGKFAASNATPAQVDEAKAALAAFEKQLASRRIDRSMLSGMAAAVDDTEESRRQMLRLRKQASDAMAVILGVHVNARIGGYLCMPSKTPGMVDIAATTVIAGLERRRPGPPWFLYRQIWSYDAAGAERKLTQGPLVESPMAPLVEELSSHGIRADEIARRPGAAAAFDFIGRSPTRSDSLTVSFAEFEQAVGPSSRQGAERTAELSMPISKPTSAAVLDILMHRDLPRGSAPAASMFASLGVAGSDPSARERLRLSLEAQVSKPASLHVESTGAEANRAYGELCRGSAARFGFDLSEFECHRIVVPHPPVPCTIMMSWDLA